MSNVAALKTELLKPSVLKEGHLIKLGKSRLKMPKLHYYVLKPCGVYCFGTQENDVPHAYIPLEPIEDISLSLGSVIEASTRLHCIKIADKRKQHVLACSSMEIRNSWITAILTAVAQNLVNESDSDILRKRLNSSSTNSDEMDGVFGQFGGGDVQFTSPFWSNEVKRKAKSKRHSIADLGLLQKPAWMSKGKKKELRSKSLSLEDMHSIYTMEDAKAPLARKRSLHDLTRYLFSSGSKQPDVDLELPKLRINNDAQGKPNRAKKRWSLLPTFGSGQNAIDISVTERKKLCTAVGGGGIANGQCGSPLIFDTKL